MKEEFTTIDLCSGIGGIRKGFELTGHFKNVFSADNNKKACEVYEHLFHDSHLRDITDYDTKQEISRIKFDVLLCGFPCQPFSIAGKRKGFDDENGKIFFHLCEIISRNRPKALFLENTKNLLSINKGETFRQILNVLTNQLNYTVIGVKQTKPLIFDKHSFVRNTKNFGLPQKRERVYILALNNDYFDNRFINHDMPFSDGSLTVPNLDDILTESDDITLYLSENYLQYLEEKKERNKKRNCNFAYDIVNIGNKPHLSNCLTRSISGMEQNLIQDSNKFGGLYAKNKRSPINNKGIRYLSVDECARLQGFKDYAFYDSISLTDKFSFPANIGKIDCYRLIGNSVSIPVVKVLAEFLYRNMIESMKVKE